MSEQIRVEMDHGGTSVFVGTAYFHIARGISRRRSKTPMSMWKLDGPIPSTQSSHCRRSRSAYPVCRKHSPTVLLTDGVALSWRRSIGGRSPTASSVTAVCQASTSCSESAIARDSELCGFVVLPTKTSSAPRAVYRNCCHCQNCSRLPTGPRKGRARL